MKSGKWMKRMPLVLALSLMALSLLAACTAPDSGQAAANGGIEIQDAWARQAAMMGDGGGAMGGGNGAGYMVIRNTGERADRLLKAESDAAETLEIHQTVIENDVMKMSPVEAIEVPANDQVELKQGGYHLMFLGLKQNLSPDQPVTVRLTFEQAGEIEVTLEVRNP